MLEGFLERFNPSFAPEGTGGGSNVPGGGSSSAPGSASTSSATSPSPPSGANGSSPPASSPSGAPLSAPAPSSTPAAPSAAPLPSAPGGTPDVAGVDFDFDSIFGGGFYPEPAAPVEAKPAASPPATAPVQPPVSPQPSPPAIAAGTGPEQPAQPAAAQPVQQQPATSPAAPQFDPGDPNSIAQFIQQNEQAYVDHLSKTMFALSQDDLAALETDVGTAVPRLLSRVYVQAAMGQMAQIARSVPLMVQRHLEVSAARRDSEDTFYKRWPQISRDTHHALVNKYAMDLRRMHPEMTTEEMMNRVGPLVMMQAGIPFNTPASSGAPGGSQPPQAVAPRVATVNGPHGQVQVPQPAPFVPAPPGVAGAIPIPDPNADFSFMAGGQDE